MKRAGFVSKWPKLIGLLAGLGLVALGLGLRDLALVLDPPARFGFGPEATADLALVLSGDPGELRTRAAAGLVIQGRVPRLLISGAGYGGDSAEVLAQTAYALGVKADRVGLETEATTTYENIQRSAAWMHARGLEPARIVIVTTTTHAARAGLVAERGLPGVQIRVLTVPGPGTPSLPLREVLSLLAYRILGRVAWW